jgi:integrase
MPLTDMRIRQAKPGPKPIKLSDGEGLQLVISPAGGRAWKLAYRISGKQRELSIGPYPAISLQEARQRKEAAKALLADGQDPAEAKKLERQRKAASDATTFAMIAAELCEKKRTEGLAIRTLAKLQWLYGLIDSTIGKRPVAAITPPELLEALRPIERSGRLETAKRLRAVCGEVFRYAIATGRAVNDPSSALRGALASPLVTHRAAIVDAVAFGGCLRAIDGVNGQPTTIAALRLLALLFPRPGELRLAEWSEFDMARAVWVIPASRMKMRKEHRVPLPHQALALLEDLRSITSHGALLFPGFGMSGGTGRKVAPKPISENTLNGALRRMGFGPDEMTAHGFRASASTLLNESGLFSSDAIERALAHQDADAVRRAYARGEFWEERVRMMQWWADHIDAMRQGNRPASIRKD